MKKNRLPKPITILILTLLTAVLWVGLNIYRTFTIKPDAPVPESVSNPLNPVLNTEVIQQIESAIYIPDSEIPQIGTNIQITATPLPVLTEEEMTEAETGSETESTESGSFQATEDETTTEEK